MQFCFWRSITSFAARRLRAEAQSLGSETLRPIQAYHLTMLPTNNISERLVDLKAEMSELKINNLRYWAQSQRFDLDKSAHGLRQDRLLLIKQEFSDMMKRFG